MQFKEGDIVKIKAHAVGEYCNEVGCPYFTHDMNDLIGKSMVIRTVRKHSVYNTYRYLMVDNDWTWSECMFEKSVSEIKNSPKKESIKNLMEKTLKKTTNLIAGMIDPLKTYYRLGWVEIKGDEYVVTQEGKDAIADYVLLSPIADIEDYAKAELLKREKAEREASKRK